MHALTARHAWIAMMVVTVGGALLSLPPSDVGALTPDCNVTAPVCGGSCLENNTICYGVDSPNATACSCVPSGCCRLNETTCSEQVAQPACLNSTFVAGGTCENECAPPTATATATATATDTPTATATATVTATRTGIPDGGACLDPVDCQSGNCVDDVCCDTACDGAEQSCNLEGSVGTCTSVAAPAPAASNNALLVGVALLLAVGGLAMWRRRAEQR